MKSKFVKLFLGASTTALTAVSLSSCAATKTNLFGIYAPIVSNYTENTSTATTKDNSSASDTSKTTKPEAMKYTFNDFYFNNFGYASSSTLYAKNTSGDYSTLSNSYSSNSWVGVLYPIINYLDNLMDLYIAGFNGNIEESKAHPVLSTSESSSDNLLTQFIYSWSNSSKITNNSLVRFGITGVSLNFKSDASTNSSSKESSVTTTISSGLYPSDGYKLTYNKDKSTATYTSTVSFQIAVKLGYWNALTNNPKQNTLNSEEVKNAYSSSSWASNISDFKDSMYLVFNYSNLRTTLTYTKAQITGADSTTSITDSTTDITWKSQFNQLIPSFSFSTATTASKKETTSSSETTSSANAESTSTTPTLATLDNSAVSTAITSIKSLLTSSSLTTSKLNEEKDKYKNSLTLTSTAPTGFKYSNN